VTAALATAATIGDARAWYFPEHVVIADDGIAQLAPAVRQVLEDAVERARRDGLALCRAVDVRFEDVAQQKQLVTRMMRSDVSVPCVPYSALPALAGDHASSPRELRAVLTSAKGIEITSAAAFEWRRFRKETERGPTTSLERMSFVHELDVDFYFIDPGYELRAQATRAHFADAGRPLADVARGVVTGAIDNSLGQFLVHHIRSLASAAHDDVTEALLEHGFAVHFLQDAFSAGHLSMTKALWSKVGNPGARRRHDFFNAKGLRVARALNVAPCTTLGIGFTDGGVSPCWTTSGDGYLGVYPDSTDRVHAARAVAKADLELAIALAPKRVAEAVAAMPVREQAAIGELLEPVPWWTLDTIERSKSVASAPRARRLVDAAVSAIGRLAQTALAPPVTVGAPLPAGAVDAAIIADAIDPCAPEGAIAATLRDESDPNPCGATRALALGTVGVSLVRPLLAEWPTSQADAATLEGEATLDHGWALQLLVAANASTLIPPRGRVDFFAPAVGVLAGISYRSGTYLPGRRDRPLIELDVGLSAAIHYDSAGIGGGAPYVTMLDQELRWPIAWELFTSYLLPLDLRRNHETGTVLLLGGARAHELLMDPMPVFWGIDFELVAVALSRGRGVYPLYASSPELRFYIGAADAGIAQPARGHTLAPTVGITLTGGYATFL
jgi:hypothetical protein